MFQSIATNTLSQVFSKFGTALISIVLLGVLTKYLSVEMFGLYNKVYNYLGIFAFLADLGLYTIAIREITENKNKTASIVGNVLILRILLGIIILFLSLAIASFLPGYNSDTALWGIAIIGVFTIVSLINSSLLALMQAYMKMEFSLFSVIAGKLLNIALVSYIVFFVFPGAVDYGLPLLAIFGAGLAGITLTTALNYTYANARIIPVRFHYDRQYIEHIFRISLPYGVALFLGVVYFKVDVVILSLLEAEPLADISIALYSLPMKIVEVLMVLGGFYLNSLLPSLSEAYKKNDTKKLQKLIDISLKVLMSFGICVFVFGTLLSEHVIRIIANENYINNAHHIYSSSDVFGIVLAVLLFHFISLVFVYVLIAAKKQSKLLWINLVVTVCNIVGNCILIPHYSFMGAGIVTVLSQILLMILGYIVASKIVSFRFDVLYYVGVIFLGVFFYVATGYLLQEFPLGLYLDVIVYGGGIGMVFLTIVYSFIRQRLS